jgi:hypothetical protein
MFGWALVESFVETVRCFLQSVIKLKEMKVTKRFFLFSVDITSFGQKTIGRTSFSQLVMIWDVSNALSAKAFDLLTFDQMTLYLFEKVRKTLKKATTKMPSNGTARFKK